MSRPGFALSVLLVTFSGLLFAIRAANGEQFESRVGGVKFGLCPLVGDELYDGGFAAHTCDVGYSPITEYETPTPPSPSAQLTRYWPLTSCCVSEWISSIPGKIRASISSQSNQAYLSGYDVAYDKAVYGEPSLVQTILSHFSQKPFGSEQQCVSSQQRDWSGWDWCEGECGACVKASTAGPVTAAVKKPMEQEPSSIEEYYSMYGGEPQDYSNYEDNYGYTPANVETINVVEIVKQWMDGYSIQSTWEFAESEYIARRDQLVHRLMQSQYWSNIAGFYRAWNHEIERANEGELVASPAQQECGRLAVLAVARSLDRAASMLQNASRCLTQLVENPPVEVSAAPDASNER